MLNQLAIDVILLCVSKLIFCFIPRHALYFVSTRHVVGVLSIVYFLFRCLHVFLLDSKGNLENQTEVVLSTTNNFV